MKTIVTLMLLLLISCGSSKDKMKEETTKGVEKTTKSSSSSEFETLVVAQMGGFVTPQIHVIKEQQYNFANRFSCPELFYYK